MKLGLLTVPFPGATLTQVAEWAGPAGFEALEVACWPKTTGATRRYAGTTHIDVASFSDQAAQETRGALEEKGLVISALGYYPNPLHPDLTHRRAVLDHLKAVIAAASRFGGDGQHLLRRRRRAGPRRQLGRSPAGLARDHRGCSRSWGEACVRELPDDLQPRRMAGRAQHRLFAANLAAHPRKPGVATSA